MRLLLDSHINKATVGALQRRCPRADVVHISEWRGGVFRSSEDSEILAACFDENRTFVTYDQRTIPELLRRWAEEGRAHAGVVFADANTVPPDRPGLVAASIENLIDELSESDMTNVVRYLRRR